MRIRIPDHREQTLVTVSSYYSDLWSGKTYDCNKCPKSCVHTQAVREFVEKLNWNDPLRSNKVFIVEDAPFLDDEV